MVDNLDLSSEDLAYSDHSGGLTDLESPFFEEDNTSVLTEGRTVEKLS
jgi:hypothetical protein